MAEGSFKYVIVGGGLAGASAAEGIREVDQEGSILLLGSEIVAPYNRPPLSKDLWTGKAKPEEIFVHDKAWYDNNNVTLAFGVSVEELDPGGRLIQTENEDSIQYEKLLLATGGKPRTLEIPGSGLGGVCYFRTFADYQDLRGWVGQGKAATVVGGGFIGSEIAAALNMNGVDVTMVFPAPYIVDRVFPPDLARAIQEEYRARGVTILTGDAPESFTLVDGRLETRTRETKHLQADTIVVGVGITPGTELALLAKLTVEDGINVDDRLRTSDPSIYAAGDNASFPYKALGKRMRVEHWDNALNQGKQAGRNMAGANEPYEYMPFFFSDLFEFGYEAVGECDARLETFADWQEEFKTGVVYYLKDGKVRGAMMCNVWEKVDAARELIRSGAVMSQEDLRGAIR